ncbi:MAG: hypothetical protein ACOY45_10235, partial [Pseudomonadota bacterium]
SPAKSFGLAFPGEERMPVETAQAVSAGISIENVAVEGAYPTALIAISRRQLRTSQRDLVYTPTQYRIY